MEGLMELARFVEEGGTLITEGSTAALMAEFNLNSGVTVEHPPQLFARGSILRGTFADIRAPSRMVTPEKDLPVYFNQDPVLFIARRASAPGSFSGGQNLTPNVGALHVSTLEGNQAAVPSPVLGGPGPRFATRRACSHGHARGKPRGIFRAKDDAESNGLASSCSFRPRPTTCCSPEP